MAACLVTVPFNPANEPIVGAPGNCLRKTGLKKVTCSASVECMIWVLRVRSVSATAMPTPDPILRVRLKIAVPSLRKCSGRVEKAATETGTYMRPVPRP